MTNPRGIDPGVAQRLASDPACSVWVGASAGTGKTKVLTDRVLRLMLTGTAPERILCITFTKAAAAEMAQRIATTLGSWAAMPEARLDEALFDMTGQRPEPDLRDRARRLFAQVVDCPAGMPVMTLHAFAQSLLRRFPVEAGLMPSFEVMDERTASELRRHALYNLLALSQTGKQDELAAVIGRVADIVTSADALLSLLLELRTQRNGPKTHPIPTDQVRAMLGRVLEIDAKANAAAVFVEASAESAFDRQALIAATDALMSGKDAYQERAGRIRHWINTPEQRVDGFLAYAGVFLTQEGSVRKQLAVKAMGAATSETLRLEGERVYDVLERHRRHLMAEYTADLLILADAFNQTYARLKETTGRLDFDDLIMTAQDLLERPGVAAWVLFKLDGGIDHVLIDEAQDTNPRQWAIARALTDEFFSGEGKSRSARTLFVVGDEKQSIFGFQGADPQEFDRMRGYFRERIEGARMPFRSVDLTVSFRSLGAVLQVVDLVFARESVRRGVVVDATQHISHSPQRGAGGRVELWPLVEKPQKNAEPDDSASAAQSLPEKPPRVRLAQGLAQTIGGWISRKEILPARGRPITAGDILVLVRHRTPFEAALVRALKARGIAVAGTDRVSLTSQLSVQDLTTLAKILLLPEDDLSLAVVLKGPFIGLPEEALMALAIGRSGSLWQALGRAADAATAPSLLGAAWHWLTQLLARVDYTAPYDLFAQVLVGPCPADPDGSGRRAILRRLGAEAADPLDELLLAAVTYETDRAPTLQDFLHWLAAGDDEIKREMDQVSSGVRIMTVHGSKGLQAPIVILPDTTSLPQERQRKIWWADKGDSRIPLWLSKAWENAPCSRLLEEARVLSGAEYRRLLYVALTRAEDRLIICGSEPGKGGIEGSWYDLVKAAMEPVATKLPAAEIADIDWAGEGLLIDETERFQPAPLASSQPKPAENWQGPLPDWARQSPQEEKPLGPPLRPSRPNQPEPPVFSPAQADGRRRFRRGALIHRLLQLLPGLPPDTWTAVLNRHACPEASGLDPEDFEQIIRQIRKILETPEWAHLFGAGSLAEVPLVGVVAGRPMSGRIDRVHISPERVTILEFKSGWPGPDSIAAIPPAFLAQLALYRAGLMQIWPGRLVDAAFLWTDTARLMAVPGDILDQHLPQQAGMV